MALASHRVGLVVLEYETLNVNHQLGTRLPAVVRLRIAAPANEVARSLPLLITVLQDTPHVEASSTVRVHQWLWWRREDQFRLVCRNWNARLIGTSAYSVSRATAPIKSIMTVVN